MGDMGLNWTGIIPGVGVTTLFTGGRDEVGGKLEMVDLVDCGLDELGANDGGRELAEGGGRLSDVSEPRPVDIEPVGSTASTTDLAVDIETTEDRDVEDSVEERVVELWKKSVELIDGDGPLL